MVKEILKGIGLALAFVAIVFVGLLEIRGSVSVKTLSDNSSAIKYMKDNFDAYDKCRYSIENGETRIGWITLGYHFKASDELKQRLDDITNQFMETVKAECIDIIDKYEQARDTQEKTSLEMAEAQLSLYDKWILKTKVIQESQVIKEPYVFHNIQNENEYIFTNKEVEVYFSKMLGFDQ